VDGKLQLSSRLGMGGQPNVVDLVPAVHHNRFPKRRRPAAMTGPTVLGLKFEP
jgi:hypothetical protein